MFKDSRILITGGTGTLGQELSKQLLDYNCREIIIFSRSEISQVSMKRDHPEFTYIIGDVRDEVAVKKALKFVDVCFHLAAIKHVGICEKQPDEAFKTNICGTYNLVSHFNYSRRFVSMSTDKAVNPSSVYGYTKAIGERIVLSAGGIVVRSGNIFGSSGSVIPLFIKQVKENNEISLTDGNMTRFFITVKQLAKFILQETEVRKEGLIYPLNMPAFTMRMVAEVVKEFYGNGATSIKEEGRRPGEKMHESLDGTRYSNEVVSDAGTLKEMFYDCSYHKL